VAQQREEALKRADVRAAEEGQLARVHARNVLMQQRRAPRRARARTAAACPQPAGRSRAAASAACSHDSFSTHCAAKPVWSSAPALAPLVRAPCVGALTRAGRRAGEIQRKRELMAAADAKRLEIRTAQRMQRAAELAAFLKTATAQPPLLWLPARHCEDTLLLLEQRQVDLAAWQARPAPRGGAASALRGRTPRCRARAATRGGWVGQGCEAHAAAGRFLGRAKVGLGGAPWRARDAACARAGGRAGIHGGAA